MNKKVAIGTAAVIGVLVILFARRATNTVVLAGGGGGASHTTNIMVPDDYYDAYHNTNPGVPDITLVLNGQPTPNTVINVTQDVSEYHTTLSNPSLNTLSNRFMPLFGLIGAVGVPNNPITAPSLPNVTTPARPVEGTPTQIAPPPVPAAMIPGAVGAGSGAANTTREYTSPTARAFQSTASQTPFTSRASSTPVSSVRNRGIF